MTTKYLGYTGVKANADLDTLVANAAAGAAAYGVAAAASAAAAAALAAANAVATGFPHAENRTTPTMAAYNDNGREYNIRDYYNPVLTNWAPIINAASLAANAAGGGIVRVPVGTFDVSVSLNTYAGVTLAGTGPLSLIRVKAGLGAPIRMVVPSAVGISGGGLRDLTLDHRADLYPSNGSSPCVSVDKTDSFTIQNCTFLNAETMAVWCDSPTATPTTKLSITNCRFMGYAGDATTTTGTVGGVSLFGAHTDSNISNNFFTHHRDDAVAIQDSVNGRPVRCVVSGNTFVNNNRRFNGSTPHAILIYGCLNTTVSGNVVDGTVAPGIWAGSGAFNDLEEITITGNTVRNAGISSDSTAGVPGAGIYVLGDRANSRFTEGVTITGNNVRLSRGNGIYLQDTNGATITGNTVKLNSNNGVSLNQCLDVTITGNTILNNGTSAAGLELNGIILFGVSPTVTCDGIVITGNRIGDTRAGGARTQTYALYLSGGANLLRITFHGNNVANNLTGVIGGAPPITLDVRENAGYNPVGISTQGLGGSPWTYQNQSLSPMNVHIVGGTVSDISKGGLTLFSASPGVLHLEPGESFTLTYSSAPIMRIDVE